MFGLDDKIAAFSDGTTLLVVAGVAILLGLRHASEPAHLAAVTTLTVFTLGTTWRFIGLGLSEISSAGLIYLAAFFAHELDVRQSLAEESGQGSFHLYIGICDEVIRSFDADLVGPTAVDDHRQHLLDRLQGSRRFSP